MRPNLRLTIKSHFFKPKWEMGNPLPPSLGSCHLEAPEATPQTELLVFLLLPEAKNMAAQAELHPRSQETQG